MNALECSVRNDQLIIFACEFIYLCCRLLASRFSTSRCENVCDNESYVFIHAKECTIMLEGHRTIRHMHICNLFFVYAINVIGSQALVDLHVANQQVYNQQV